MIGGASELIISICAGVAENSIVSNVFKKKERKKTLSFSCVCSGTFVFFLAGLVQKSSLLCMLLRPNGHLTSLIWIDKVKKKALRAYCPNIYIVKNTIIFHTFCCYVSLLQCTLQCMQCVKPRSYYKRNILYFFISFQTISFLPFFHPCFQKLRKVQKQIHIFQKTNIDSFLFLPLVLSLMV